MHDPRPYLFFIAHINKKLECIILSFLLTKPPHQYLRTFFIKKKKKSWFKTITHVYFQNKRMSYHFSISPAKQSPWVKNAHMVESEPSPEDSKLSKHSHASSNFHVLQYPRIALLYNNSIKQTHVYNIFFFKPKNKKKTI